MDKLNEYDRTTIIQCVYSKMTRNRIKNIEEVKKLPLAKLSYEQYNIFIEKMTENGQIKKDQQSLELALKW